MVMHPKFFKKKQDKLELTIKIYCSVHLCLFRPMNDKSHKPSKYYSIQILHFDLCIYYLAVLKRVDYLDHI